MACAVSMLVLVVAWFTAANCGVVGPQHQQPLADVENVELIVKQRVGVSYTMIDPENEGVELDELEEVEGLSEVDGLSTVGGEAKAGRTSEAELTPNLNLQPVIGKRKDDYILYICGRCL